MSLFPFGFIFMAGDTMKSIQTVQGLCLMAIFTGALQVLCLVELPLTMFNHSVDDQYTGCNLARESKLQKSGNLPLEEKYSKTWETAKRHWDSLGQSVGSFNPAYGIAIVAYTVGDNLYRDFNAAVREAGKSQDSYHRYAFRDFHLLLTRAVQAKKTEGECHEVFRGIKEINFIVSDKVVRFGQFASSSLNKTVAQEFGEDTFFYIRTCYGVPIHDFSFHKKQEEVLIPPYETFTVTDHGRIHSRVYIRLESRGMFSRYNCEVLNAAGPLGTSFLLWGLLLTWTILRSQGSL